MAHDINSALERLEKNLSELDSARSQVMQSVNASNDLLKMVTQYVAAVKKLAASLEEWESSLSGRESELHGEFGSAIASIKQTCTDIISAFKVDVNKATLDFKKDTDKTLEKFIEQNDKLAERVTELVALREQIKKATEEIESVKSALNEILKELKDSQDEQDATLEDLKAKVTGLNEKIENSKVAVLQAITHSEQSLSAILHQTNEKIDSVSGKADALASNVASLTTICQNIDTLVQSSTNSITATINKVKDEVISAIQESKEETLKSANINRWLIVAGIITLAILQLVFK